MNNLEFRRKLNRLADKLFPDILLDFILDDINIDIFIGYVRIESSVSIDRKEVVYNGILNKSKLKSILKIRVKNALIELQNLIKESLEKL